MYHIARFWVGEGYGSLYAVIRQVKGNTTRIYLEDLILIVSSVYEFQNNYCPWLIESIQLVNTSGIDVIDPCLHAAGCQKY